MPDTDSEIADAVAAVVTAVRNHPPTMDALARLGRALVALMPPPAAPPPPVEMKPAPPAPPAFKPAPTPPLTPRPPSPAAIAGPTIVVPAPTMIRAELTFDDLPRTADRFDLKADGCDWHVQRRELLSTRGTVIATDVAPRDKAIMDRARALEGCWMWMCRPESPAPEESCMETLAGCYRAAARAVRLVMRARTTTGPTVSSETTLSLLAESLSAVRAAVRDIDDYTDSDQDAVFKWLRNETHRESVYIERHMRADDPADPNDWRELTARIAEFDGKLDQSTAAQRSRSSGLNKVKYHAAKLAVAVDDADAGFHADRLADAVEQVIAGGLQPSNVGLREALVPVVDRLKTDDGKPGYARVLGEVTQYLTARDSAPVEEEEEPDAAPSPDVEAVRVALAGKAVVFVGGEERKPQTEALRSAFHLSRLDWLTTRAHESHYNFEAAIARPDVAVVLLAIRWSSHSFAEIKAFCDTHDKPMVRLPGGYGVNQVAATVRGQAGIRLGIG